MGNASQINRSRDSLRVERRSDLYESDLGEVYCMFMALNYEETNQRNGLRTETNDDKRQTLTGIYTEYDLTYIIFLRPILFVLTANNCATFNENQSWVI